jgi:GTP-binding protein Era
MVREKLFRQMGDELPYTTTVVVDKFEEEGKLKRITASIVVKQESHKGMVIGYKGERLKNIGSQARQDLEKLLGGRVFLQLWVRVCATWADDATQLRAYGYG